MTVYDPQLLATFVAVEQTGSFTRAAARLGIQQPTVSQHIRRLEQQVGRTLVLRDTHSVSLTADGEAMLGFARNILTACEQASAYFTGSRPRGRLRIGIADDLALTRLPHILRDFRRENPLVDFDLTVDQSGLLHQRLEDNKLDVFIGKRPSGEQRGQLVKRDRLVWVGTPSTRLDLTKPLPLVVYPAPSISRTEMRRGLNRAGVPFRSACVCRGVNGLIAAVSAGIGVSALAASLVPAQLTALGPGHRLPELGTIDLVLLTNPRTAQRPAVRALISTVLTSGPRSLISGLLEAGRVAGSAAYDLGLGLREVDHSRGLGAAVAGVDDRVQSVTELLLDLPPLGHRLLLTGQQQGARDERFAQFGEQCLSHHVAGDPDPGGLLARVLQPAGHLFGRGQDERVAARRRRLDGPEHRVVDVDELAQLGEVLAYQREVMPVVELADRPDPGDAVGVAELAAERVARVRWVSDHATRPHDIGDLGDRPPLRIGRMDVEVPGHAMSLDGAGPDEHGG